MYYVYRVTIKFTGECYIGYTSRWRARVKKHVQMATNNTFTALTCPTTLYPAARKAGCKSKEDFIFEQLAIVRYKHDVHRVENQIIKQHVRDLGMLCLNSTGRKLAA
jgi:predicted GIY-YIG superfamily endonuclease